MNDLPNSVETANITMFADDTSLFRSFKSIGELDMELLPAFTNICKCLKANKLNLNTVKDIIYDNWYIPESRTLGYSS